MGLFANSKCIAFSVNGANTVEKPLTQFGLGGGKISTTDFYSAITKKVTNRIVP